ncbi:MAG: serine hydrolase domain-containing protein [Oscillospiraceae bacterium]
MAPLFRKRLVPFLLASLVLLASCTMDRSPAGMSSSSPPPASSEPSKEPQVVEPEPSSSSQPDASPELEEPATPIQEQLSSTNPSAFAEMDATLAEIARTNSVSGCSLSIFEGEDILYSGSWGTASYRGGVTTAASADTKYRIASISKMVTAMLTMTLVEDGKLSLDDELSQLIDVRLVSPDWPDDPPILEQLLSHTSGIVDSAAYNKAIGIIPYPSLDSLLDWGSSFSGNKPGTTYSYSNFGMGLVAAAIEKGSEQYFYDYANDTLFDPMELDAGFMTDFVSDQDNIAAMGDVDPVSWGSMKRYYSSIPLGQMYLLAQGELYISADDLAKVTMILAGDGSYNGVQYLMPESIENMHTKRVYDEETNTARGLAVQIADDIVDGITLYGHQGNAYGSISCVFYDPVTHRGAVFLTNGSTLERADNYVYQVNNDIIQAVWKCFEL